MGMQITITKAMGEAMVAESTTEKPIAPELRAERKAAMKILEVTFNIEAHEFRYNREKTIDVTRTPHAKLTTLRKAFHGMKGIRGHKAAVLNIDTWLGAQDTTGQKKAKNCHQWMLLTIAFLAEQKHQRFYMKGGDDETDGGWRAYHMSSMSFTPGRMTDWGWNPPYITAQLAYREFGIVHASNVTISESRSRGLTPLEGLRACGLFMETEALRDAYLAEAAHWKALVTNIGQQCLARGQADDDLDGNPSQNRNTWYWRRNTITLDPQGEPGHVVIDVFSEEDKKPDKDATIDTAWWQKQRPAKPGDKGFNPESDDDEDSEDETEEDDAEPVDESPEVEGGESTALEIPIYPMLAVFDLRRHLRVRVHLSQLEEYVYDTSLGRKLILPADVRDLVTVLLSHKSQFADVVKGKGGGVCILCAGPPGTGKTLTAEVYSEVMKRPLYAVQTAQLGLSAASVENELRRIFARSARWGAILLLDEADVYVRARGDDMDQNAIVGVFLRTLEYYQGILFLTTNRADSIDDAIASRCIARIDYKNPHPNDAKRIWRTQADQNGADLTDATIDAIVEKHHDLSGRDIKNLVKLAQMVQTAKSEPITLDVIDFVKRFKPTGPGNQDESREGGSLNLPKAARKPRAAAES